MSARSYLQVIHEQWADKQHMPECGHAWLAPYLLPNGVQETTVEQVCVLPRGHDGQHLSTTGCCTMG